MRKFISSVKQCVRIISWCTYNVFGCESWLRQAHYFCELSYTLVHRLLYCSRSAVNTASLYRNHKAWYQYSFNKKLFWAWALSRHQNRVTCADPGGHASAGRLTITSLRRCHLIYVRGAWRKKNSSMTWRMQGRACAALASQHERLLRRNVAVVDSLETTMFNGDLRHQDV